MDKTKAMKLQKWFFRYGITKAQITLMEFYRFSSDVEKRYVWQIFIESINKIYKKGYKDGFEKGKDLQLKRCSRTHIPNPILNYLEEFNVRQD